MSSRALPPLKMETGLSMCVLFFMCQSFISLSKQECFVRSSESYRRRLQIPRGFTKIGFLIYFPPNFTLFPLGLSKIVKTN